MGENRAGRAVEVTVDAHAPDQCVFSNPTDSSLKHDVYSTPCIPPFLPILIYANWLIFFMTLPSVLILGGDFFTGAVLANALTKLVLRFDELTSDSTA